MHFVELTRLEDDGAESKIAINFDLVEGFYTNDGARGGTCIEFVSSHILVAEPFEKVQSLVSAFGAP